MLRGPVGSGCSVRDKSRLLLRPGFTRVPSLWAPQAIPAAAGGWGAQGEGPPLRVSTACVSPTGLWGGEQAQQGVIPLALSPPLPRTSREPRGGEQVREAGRAGPWGGNQRNRTAAAVSGASTDCPPSGTRRSPSSLPIPRCGQDTRPRANLWPGALSSRLVTAAGLATSLDLRSGAVNGRARGPRPVSGEQTQQRGHHPARTLTGPTAEQSRTAASDALPPGARAAVRGGRGGPP